MKVLVTGTAGFVGYHLVEKLIADGHDVVGIDNINDYYDVNLKYGRLAQSGIAKENITPNTKVTSTAYPTYAFYQIALEDFEAMNALFTAENFDTVINLAAQAGVRYSIENPHVYVTSNVVGFVNLLECCKANHIKHLVYSSSSSVYGLNTETIFNENDAVDHPVSLYAATKRSNELMAHVYSHLFNLPTTGVRFFTVYGPWGRPDMAPMLFSDAISNGRPIKIFNEGNMMRDFTYVGDIVEGLSKIMLKQPEADTNFADAPSPANSPAPYRIYNIGNSSPVKLMDFITTLEQELGIKAQKNFLPMQPGDVVSTYADVTALTQDIKYRPTTSLKEGVTKFVKWYKDFYNI